MTTTLREGRLCNQLIRNICVSIVAKKYNLKVNYCSNNEISSLGLELYSGEKVFEKEEKFGAVDFERVMNGSEEEINYNLITNHCSYQTRYVTNYLYNYFRKPEIKENIMKANTFHKNYNNNNDCFIHVRLGDIQHLNPGFQYYIKALSLIHFNNNIILATDSYGHPIFTELFYYLSSRYNVSIINYLGPIDTIKLGSTIKNIILSHGTFSATIGYLAFYSNIYYPKINPEKIWHGDLFSIPNWNEVDY